MNTPKLSVLSLPELTKEAGGDPWQLQDQLLAGKRDRINAMAEAFHRSGSNAGEADSAFDTARKHFQDAYTSGDRSDVIDDSAVVKDVKARLHGSADALGKIGTHLEEIAASLADAQNKTHPPIDALNHWLTELESEYLKFLPFGLPDVQRRQQLLQSIKKTAVSAVAATYRQMKRTVEGYENILDARMKELEKTGYLPPVQLEDAASNTDPKAVYKWWTLLTPAERQALIADHPDVIGNLNGIPVADRSAANMQVMNADIHRVEDNPKKYGLTADDITRYHNAKNVQAGLNAYSGREAGQFGPYLPTYLYAYQPLAFGGKGRAAIAIGNPDTAPNTAVLVPGASQSVRASDGSDKGWFAVQSSQAHNLYAESNKADPAHPTAVVAWMGYDSPANGITAVLSGDPTAERAGGQLLARDVDGLWATHQGSSHVTTVGYSAGAIVTSDAAAASHLHTNDMVLLGPVSTDQAHHAADYHLDGGHVYVGEASNDLNAHAGHAYLNALSLGGQADPTAPDFGATRIKAETPPSYSSPIYYSGQAHLHYFTHGSESLYATTDITSGHADRLADDHMLATPDKKVPAPGRAGEVGVTTVQEGETTDGVTDDHHH
ncbi:putative alpha/beta hydrolase [Nocardia araoensis]|uniref:putative alpha/beta hydrolase n=1 Tax=Nocardia araoensis TaxID=228600 RepID=UPI0003200E85|nr:alpha/beta hydrolase [Nocardia araoensis]